MSEPGEAAPDGLVGNILGALAFGVTLGVGLLALVTWAVRTIQTSGTPLPVTARGLTAGLLPVVLLGTLGAMVAAGLGTWVWLAPIGNPWRKAMLGIIAGAGSFVVALSTWPVDRAFGRNGLLALAGVAALVCLLLGRRLTARRGAA